MTFSKQNVKYLFLLIFIVGIGTLVYATVTKWSHKKMARQNLENLSFDELVNLDGSQFDANLLRAGVPMVLIYFNSECDFCQLEAVEIVENIELLEEVDILMVSSEAPDRVISFRIEYELIQYNIHFAIIDLEVVYRQFGSTSIPAVFVYSNDGVLIESFKGKTKILTILNSLSSYEGI